MKKYNYKTLSLAFFLFAAAGSSVWAQDIIERPNVEQKQNFNQARRPNLLAALDLTADQIREIRRINTEKKTQMRDAQIKVREANRNLDLAIYAENPKEDEIQARLKEAQTAQAEVTKIRAMIEYAVRKVLTTEQLTKFREIRRNFMQQKENLNIQRKNRRMNNSNQKILNRQRRSRANF